MTDLVPFLPQLAIAWTAYFIATVSPGPAILAIVATSVSQGRRAGLTLAAGVLTGSYIWALLTASGLSAIVGAYGHAIVILKIAGACYLLWLAFNALRSAMKPTHDITTAAPRPTSMKRLYLKGLGIHLTNPKAIFAWIMLISLGMPVGAPAHSTALFIAGCMILGLIVFGGMALIFSLGPVNRAYLRSRRLIEGLMAGFFAFAGLRLLTAKL